MGFPDSTTKLPPPVVTGGLYRISEHHSPGLGLELS